MILSIILAALILAGGFVYDRCYLEPQGDLASVVRNFRDDPISINLLSCPKAPNGQFSNRTYRWYFKREFPDASRPIILTDKTGLQFCYAPIPNGNILVHCWTDKNWQFEYEVIARHVSNDRKSELLNSSQHSCVSRPAISLFAVGTPDFSFSKFLMHGPSAGRKFTLPTDENPENWSFHFKISAGENTHDGATGEFVIAFDPSAQTWKIFERDWHEFNGINSWIRIPKGYSDKSSVIGF